MAVLNDIIVFATVDWSGRREDSSKMLSHFLRAWADSRKLNQCPAGERGRGDPAGTSAEEAPRYARGKRSAWNGNQQPNLTLYIYLNSAKMLALIRSCPGANVEVIAFINVPVCV
jgi:hypothetical protein